MEHEKLLKELQALETNLDYYQRDLKKHQRKLKKEYGVKPDSAKKRMKQIETEINRLLEKEKEVKRRIDRKLKGIKDARRSGRI